MKFEFNADNAPIHFVKGKSKLSQVSIGNVPDGSWFYYNLWGGQYKNHYYRFEILKKYEGKGGVDAAWVGESGEYFPANNPYSKLFSCFKSNLAVYVVKTSAIAEPSGSSDAIEVLNFWSTILILRKKKDLDFAKKAFDQSLYNKRSKNYSQLVEDGIKLKYLTRESPNRIRLDLPEICQNMRKGDPKLMNEFQKSLGNFKSRKRKRK